MRRLPALMLLLGIALVACGDPIVAPGDDPGVAISGSIRRTGGIAALDETWTIAADGTVVAPDGSVRHLTDTDRAAIESAVSDAAFFELADEYLPDDVCCDRFTYTVSLSTGSLAHTVVTMDAADAPEGLQSLIQLLFEAVQHAV